MPITETEDATRRLSRDWAKWPVPEMPAITPEQEPWAGVPGAFWRTALTQRATDPDRTERLHADPISTMPVGMSAGNPPYAGSSYGMPFHIVDEKVPLTQVLDISQPGKWTWAGFKPPMIPTPLPPRVRREGDPAGSFDLHAYFYDPGRKLLWEAMQIDRAPINWWRSLGRSDWGAGYSEKGIVGGGIVCWDCSKPWAGPGQPRGLVAAGIPQFPLILRWDEIERGWISHALFLALSAYADDITGPARATDGKVAGHPLRAGESLRLPWHLVDRYPVGSTEWIIATALAEFGCYVGDTAPGVGITMAQDCRFALGSPTRGPLGDMGLTLSDFEVVK